MSILRNDYPPYASLISAKKLEKAAVIEKVKVAGTREYGFYNNKFVADEWKFESVEGIIPEKIVGALNNNDMSHMLLTILRENTSAVVEGLAIAAYATGAEAIEIVMPTEDPYLTEKIRNIGKGCGIATSVIVGSVDTYATKKSIIHHIETAAAIAVLFQEKQSYEKTTVVAVRKPYKTLEEPIEITYGKTIADIVGAEEKQQTKAISIGTKLYDISAFDMIIDENFPLGNGVITLYDKKCCMADEAEKAMLAVREAGCGKCNFCREGTIQLHTIMKDITQGKGKNTDIAMIKEIGEAMSFSSLCSMGNTAANITLDTLKYFGEEVEAHIRKKRCAQEVCVAFMNIYIDPSTCVGCGDCIDVCDVNCIEGKNGYIHMIDEFDCTKCGKCIGICKSFAVIKTTGRTPKLPERLIKVGRFNKR